MSSGHGWPRAIMLALSLCALAAQARAARIVVTNDDGFESQNTQALFNALIAAGHDVILSAPFAEQSGMSAVQQSWANLPSTSSRSSAGHVSAGAPGVGPTNVAPNQYYVNSTPATAVVYGIDVQAPAKWGAPPDLVVAGPNYGINLGTSVPHSGTVGAAVTALNHGVPAIAVSAANSELTTPAVLAEITLRLVATISERGKINLPPGVGLNVNIPALDGRRGTPAYRFLFTQITREPGGTDNPPAEAAIIDQGGNVTVSPIQGTYQAPPDKAAQVMTLLRPLTGLTPAIRNPKLTNISVRSFVGGGDTVQIVGFYVCGTGPKTLLVRASGPALAELGTTGVLGDPALEVYDQEGKLVATNDNWSSDVTQAAALTTAAAKAGAFAWARGSKDAAFLITVAPGPYSIVIKSADGTPGVALAEVYDLSVD